MSRQHHQVRSASRGVQVGDRAPDFTLPSLTGEPLSLASFVGKKEIVLYFYPKDHTSGCVAEAHSFRDANHEMQKRGVVVLGESADDIPSHQNFADKYGLSFPLLADTDARISQLYGV